MNLRTDGPTVSRTFGVLAALGVLPLALLVGHFGGIARGGTAGAFALAIIFACKLRWDLKDLAWFWVAVVALTLLHVPLVIFAPWRYSGAAFLPIEVLDIAINWGLLTLLAKFMKRRNGGATAG